MSRLYFEPIADVGATEEQPSCQFSWTDTDVGRLLCSLCLFLVYPPVQLVCCGLRICESCSKRLSETSKCPGCNEEDCQVMFDRAYKRELDDLPISCPRCNQFTSGTFKDLLLHLSNHKDLKCPNCEEEFVFPQQLMKHQQHDCKNRQVSCPLAMFGCLKTLLHNKLTEHYLTKTHQIYLMKFVKQIILQNSPGPAKLMFQKTFNEQFQRNLIDALERIKLLLRDVIPMEDNCARLNAERQAMEAKIIEVRTQSSKIKEMSNNSAKLLENLHQMLMSMQKIVDEIKSKTGISLKLISADGSYIDKVNFSVLIDNGQTINSETIHTSLSGYAMKLVYEIYSDGQKQKRYFSVSVVFLMGDFDAILSWPMEYPITLSIIDTTSAKKHIEHAIPVENRATMFNRPVNDANTPFRIRQFCPVDTLLEKKNNYIQDGFLFMQLRIDFTKAGQDSFPDKQPSYHKEDPIVRDIVVGKS